MPAFQPFELERMMSKWENFVEYNLTESGVHPLTVAELIDDPAGYEDLMATELNYPQTNGILELRQNISALYPGATPDNVLVTVGCAEANFITVQALLSPGDEIVIMLPNYMQIWGIAQNYGMSVKTFHLDEARQWAPDLAELDEVVSDKTRLIAVCNPNNPTGYILTEPEMEAIVAAAERVGAWLLADEVYSGTEQHTDQQTPSFWGRYDKVLAMNSLSKAYGLPGLRVGWVVAPAETIDTIWARHEYTTITVTALANKLAALALSPEVRPRLMRRAREYARRGFSILDDWLKSHGDLFSVVPPQAAAIAFVRYNLAINSTEFMNRLRTEQSVLIVPGDHFGLDHHLRFSFGPPPDYLQTALDRIHDFVVAL
jgi:aspartate/methionine/tyrosine aminotransferase